MPFYDHYLSRYHSLQYKVKVHHLYYYYHPPYSRELVFRLVNYSVRSIWSLTLILALIISLSWLWANGSYVKILYHIFTLYWLWYYFHFLPSLSGPRVCSQNVRIFSILIIVFLQVLRFSSSSNHRLVVFLQVLHFTSKVKSCCYHRSNIISSLTNQPTIEPDKIYV